MGCVNIPLAHHMTEPGTLDPAMFSLMRTDVGASFPTEITQRTCRIKSHLSWEIGLCTAALCAMPKDWTAAWHHFHDCLQSRKRKGLISYSLSVQAGHQDQDLQWGLLNPAEKRHHAQVFTSKQTQVYLSACYFYQTEHAQLHLFSTPNISGFGTTF